MLSLPDFYDNIVVKSKIAALYTSQCPLISKIRFLLHNMHFTVINKLPTLKMRHKVEITTSGINRGPWRINSKLSWHWISVYCSDISVVKFFSMMLFNWTSKIKCKKIFVNMFLFNIKLQTIFHCGSCSCKNMLSYIAPQTI